jgi:hypothetical protein
MPEPANRLRMKTGSGQGCASPEMTNQSEHTQDFMKISKPWSLFVNKTVPVWVLLLCLLLGALFTMLFGWSVKSTLAGGDNSGYLGKAAVMIASFPTTVKSVFTTIKVDTVSKDETVRVPRTRADLTNFAPIKARPGIDVKGLVMHADMAALSSAPGWRILVGVFTIDGEVKNAALALSPDLEITRIWHLTESAIGDKQPRQPHRKFIHGFDIMNDGSVIFSFDSGISLQRFDLCGARIWSVPAEFHHTVTLDDSQEFVWTLVDSRGLIFWKSASKMKVIWVVTAEPRLKSGKVTIYT